MARTALTGGGLALGVAKLEQDALQGNAAKEGADEGGIKPSLEGCVEDVGSEDVQVFEGVKLAAARLEWAGLAHCDFWGGFGRGAGRMVRLEEGALARGEGEDGGGQSLAVGLAEGGIATFALFRVVRALFDGRLVRCSRGEGGLFVRQNSAAWCGGGCG